MAIQHWFSWQDGVDLAATSTAGMAAPNIIVHVARMVHTPVGSAPAGMVLFQPDPSRAPDIFGFVCPSVQVGKYFGAHLFQGTPFEFAPVLHAEIMIEAAPGAAKARVVIGTTTFETSLTKLGAAEMVNRPPSEMMPFTHQGVEAPAGLATLSMNGKLVEMVVPNIGIGGGPAAVWAPCGIYAR